MALLPLRWMPYIVGSWDMYSSLAPKTIITGKEDTFQDTGIIAAHDIITIQILAGQTSAYTSPGIGK